MSISVKEKWREYVEYNANKEKLYKVSELICKNYDELEVELSKISDFFVSVKELVENYSEEDKKFVVMQMQFNESLRNAKTIKLIVDELECIKKGATVEFFNGVDLFRVLDLLSSLNSRSERMLLVWKSTAVINDIKYQFKRIVIASDREKQTAILRGMIALC